MLKGSCDCGLAYRQKLAGDDARLTQVLENLEELGHLIGMDGPEAVERQRQLLRVCVTETAKVLASVKG